MLPHFHKKIVYVFIIVLVYSISLPFITFASDKNILPFDSYSPSIRVLQSTPLPSLMTMANELAETVARKNGYSIYERMFSQDKKYNKYKDTEWVLYKGLYLKILRDRSYINLHVKMRAQDPSFDGDNSDLSTLLYALYNSSYNPSYDPRFLFTDSDEDDECYNPHNHSRSSKFFLSLPRFVVPQSSSHRQNGEKSKPVEGFQTQTQTRLRQKLLQRQQAKVAQQDKESQGACGTSDTMQETSFSWSDYEAEERRKKEEEERKKKKKKKKRKEKGFNKQQNAINHDSDSDKEKEEEKNPLDHHQESVMGFTGKVYENPMFPEGKKNNALEGECSSQGKELGARPKEKDHTNGGSQKKKKKKKKQQNHQEEKQHTHCDNERSFYSEDENFPKGSVQNCNNLDKESFIQPHTYIPNVVNVEEVSLSLDHLNLYEAPLEDYECEEECEECYEEKELLCLQNVSAQTSQNDKTSLTDEETFNHEGQQISVQNIQQVLFTSSERVIDSLKQLVFKTKKNNQWKHSSTLINDKNISSQFIEEISYISPYQFFAFTNNYTENFEEKTQSGQAGVTIELSSYAHPIDKDIFLSFIYMYNGIPNEQSSIQLSDQSWSTVTSKTKTHGIATVIACNPNEKGVTGNIASYYSRGNVKNIRSVCHGQKEIVTNGNANFSLVGNLIQAGYNIPINGLTVKPYIETIISNIWRGKYHEQKKLYACSVSKNKNTSIENSIGVHTTFQPTSYSYLQASVYKVFGKQKAKKLVSTTNITHDIKYITFSNAYKNTYSGIKIDISYELQITDTLYTSINSTIDYYKNKKMVNFYFKYTY